MSSTGHQSRALCVPERLTYGGGGNIKFQPFPRFNVAAVRLNLAPNGTWFFYRVLYSAAPPQRPLEFSVVAVLLNLALYGIDTHSHSVMAGKLPLSPPLKIGGTDGRLLSLNFALKVGGVHACADYGLLSKKTKNTKMVKGRGYTG